MWSPTARTGHILRNLLIQHEILIGCQQSPRNSCTNHDNIKNKIRLGSFVKVFEKAQEHLLVNARVLTRWRVSAHEATSLRIWPPLREDSRKREVVGGSLFQATIAFRVRWERAFACAIAFVL